MDPNTSTSTPSDPVPRYYTNLRLGALPFSSHCSSVQERLVNCGSEALDTAEHLGLILTDQDKAMTLLNHFGSIANLPAPLFRTSPLSYRAIRRRSSLVLFV